MYIYTYICIYISLLKEAFISDLLSLFVHLKTEHVGRCVYGPLHFCRPRSDKWLPIDLYLRYLSNRERGQIINHVPSSFAPI